MAFIYRLLGILLIVALFQVVEANPPACGRRLPSCEEGYVCKLPQRCENVRRCIGRCVPTKTPPETTMTTSKLPTPTYRPCGGMVPNQAPCAEGHICVDDLRRPGCGMACDMLGICVKPTFCGGFAGIACPTGLTCYDDPRDPCDPKRGGADCGGLCI